MQTWVVFVGFLVLFSLQLILRHSDRARVEETRGHVTYVERRLDSIATVTRVTDRINSVELSRMHRQNRQLEQIVVGHDANIRQMRRELLLLKKSEREAMRRIEKMSDAELLRFYETVREPQLP